MVTYLLIGTVMVIILDTKGGNRMVPYVLYGAVVVIVLFILLFGGRAIVDAIRQKRVKPTIKSNP